MNNDDNTIFSASTSFTLFCQALDDSKNFLGDAFLVQVPHTLFVDQLKKVIKAEIAHDTEHVDANRLTLWKLSNPIPLGRTRDARTEFYRKIKEMNFPNPESEEALAGTGPVQRLFLSETLSEYWKQLPEPKHLHVIVQVPHRSVDNDTHASRGVKRKLDALVEPTPSSFAEPSRFRALAADGVQCNRSFEYDTIPMALLQQEFADFKEDCTKEPSAIAIQLLDNLTVAACKWYDKEDQRRDAINDVIFRTTNISFSPGVISGTARKTDGNSQPVVVPALIRECKNNEGCALFEAIGYYANFLHSQQHLDKYTRFPAILMTDVGPQIGFYGCIWSREEENIIVEPLTPVYDLTVHWRDDEARLQIAATLDAVLKAVARLDEHYQSIKSTGNEIQLDYPFQTSFVDSMGLRTNFTYEGRISNKLVFNAVSKAKKKLIVKFTRQYSDAAHRFLADLRHAPTLLAINDVQGGWKMIVMERSQYTRLDSSILELDNESRLTIKKRVREIIEKLHAQELVHGDIRQVNIFVGESTLGSPEGISIHLIDFDWAGKASVAKYPLRINTKTIRRPRDVAGGELITKTHDLEMIDLLFLKEYIFI